MAWHDRCVGKPPNVIRSMHSTKPDLMKRGLGEIVGIQGNIVVGRLPRGDRRREQPSRLAVLVDGTPAGLAEAGPARDGSATEFQFALPTHRISATLDVADPLTGRSL